MSRLRLLKVIVQPVFVEDDGESLQERAGETVALSIAELDTFPDALRAQIEAHNAGDDSPPD